MPGFLKRPWPVAIKVPLAVVALMLLVGLVLSERLLARLDESQQRHLKELSQTYLDGLSSAIAPSILLEDNWEVFDAIARAQDVNKSLHPIETIVTNGQGDVIAASDPRRHPVGSELRTASFDVTQNESFRFEAGAQSANAIRVLSYPGRTVGIIIASFDTRHLAAERQGVITTLALTNGFLTILLAATGWFLVTRMMRPVRILSAHLGTAPEIPAKPISEEVVSYTGEEFGRLFRRYNTLVHSMEEKEKLATRLAEEKRLSSLGRLASALAHEINNPLGGLFNALATLKSHGHNADVRSASLGLLERGLIGIRDVVRTTLTVYRSDKAAKDLAPTDIQDLGLLIAPEARRKSVVINIRNELRQSVSLPSTPIRQALLNLILNAVAVAPEGSQVDLTVETEERTLEIVVTDRGPGLPEAVKQVLTGAFGAPPLLDGGGLGIWTTSRLISDLGGKIEVKQPSSGGTAIRLVIPMRQLELSNVA